MDWTLINLLESNQSLPSFVELNMVDNMEVLLHNGLRQAMRISRDSEHLADVMMAIVQALTMSWVRSTPTGLLLSLQHADTTDTHGLTQNQMGASIFVAVIIAI